MEILELDREEKGEFMREILNWDNQKLAIESNKKKEEWIKTGEARFFAESYLLGQILLLRNGGSSFFKDYDRFKDNFMKLMEISAPSMLQNYFFNGKVFSLTKPVYDLLQNTSNKIFLRKHPFYVFAIDQKVKIKYEGIEILFSIFFEVGDEKGNEPKNCNYLVLGRDKRDKTEFYITGSVIDDSKIKESNTWNVKELNEIHRVIRELYANFLDYLNHPYSKQTIYKLSENNRNRIRRGKFPRQDKIVIDIKPEFFDIRRIGEKSEKSPYKYKFWVRGHFKHFRNKVRYKKIYTLNERELENKKLFYNGEFLSKWIIPYIKGNGKIKDKIRRTN